MPATESRNASATAPSGASRVDPMHLALRSLTRVSASPMWDRLGIRTQAERALRTATRRGAAAADRAVRTFSRPQTPGETARQVPGEPPRLFDPTPTEDQAALAEVVALFAAEQVRPAAADADTAGRTPDDIIATATEVGIWQLGVPERFGGVSDERSVVTNVLVAERLAHGDLGIAVACLAPAAVSTALGLWGDADQQATYLPAFTGENPPLAALAISEPGPLADPFHPGTRAVRTPHGYRLDGVKILVPAATRVELLLIGAQVTDGERDLGPALFLVEANAAGLRTEPDPAMGLRAADLGRVTLTDVRVAPEALLGEPGGPYRECLRLSRIAWSALAVGTGQAVLDHVIPYVNDRIAFGEPISHRQGVAFIVADLATELSGMRLAVHRAASRADQGLPYAREAALAARLSGRYGMQLGSDGVQLLGGHGYVKDHPVERWYRDLRAVAVLDGVVLV